MEIGRSAYPAGLAVETPQPIDRWRPFVQWFLAIPHLIIVRALDTLSGSVAFISWFVILFTGRLPEGLARLQVLYLRYSARVTTYAGFLEVDYPPFAYGLDSVDPGDYPGVAVEAQPELENRNRLTTAFRLILVIPHLVVLAVLTFAAIVVGIIAAFAVLFTGSWPEGMRTFVVGWLRWALRVNAYMVLLTDEYPPFSLD
jgi:hypothetical protein